MSTTMQVKINYFGKIPSRGDFIKACDDLSLIQLLDAWLAESMSLLTEDPRWKIHYDEAKPLDFAFMGAKNKHAIAGHIAPSADSAQRRFPFLCMCTIETEDPSEFVSTSPIILSRLWNRLSAQTHTIMVEEDAMPLLHNLATTPIEVELNSKNYDASLNDYLEIQTLGSLSAMLSYAGFKGNIRQTILALGILLQPVMASNNAYLEKSLILPLPADAMHRSMVGTFWMRLITPFLLNSNLELSLFFTQIEAQPMMVLGFSGASAHTLQAILSPPVGTTHHITLEDAEWVEEQINEDYSLKKLSSYLIQPDLSLKSALELFCSTFIGT